MNNQQTGVSAKRLTGKQQKLLRELTANPTVSEAARAAGIGRTTAHRWLNEPLFREELTRQRHLALTDAMSSVQSHTAKAVEGLVQLMDSPNEWLRRMACLDILSRSLKIREVEEVEQRLSALEAAFEKQNPNQKRK